MSEMSKNQEMALEIAETLGLPDWQRNWVMGFLNMHNPDEAAKAGDGCDKRLKIAIGGLRSIAYGDASTWPNCSSREVARQALSDCAGEKPKPPAGEELTHDNQ